MELIILVGIPGSGKSTLTTKFEGKIVGTDSLRKYFFGDEANVHHDSFIFTIAEDIIDYYLKQGWTVIFDATNTKRDRRKRFISLARKHGAKVRIVWVNCPLEVALKRNASRDRFVPEVVIKSLHKGLERPVLEEDIDIIEVRDNSMNIIELIKRG